MSVVDDLARAERALEEKQRQFVYNGVTYTLATLPGLVRDLRALRDAEAAEAESAAAKRAKEVVRKPKTLKAAQKALADAQKNFQRVSERFDSGTLGVADVETARIAVNTAAEAVARLTPARAVTQPTVTAPLPGGRPATEEEARIAQQGAFRMGAAPTDGGAGGGGGVGGAGAGGAGSVGAGAAKPAAPVGGSVLDELAARFPSFADWSESQASAYFGSDLIQVFKDIGAGVYGVGKDKNVEAITRAIEGTTYWRNTIAATKNWDQLAAPDQQKRINDQKLLLVQNFGELQLDDATLTDLATTIQRTGLSELGARQLVYGAAFKRPPTETGPQPRQLVLESEAADNIRKIAKSYGYNPPDLNGQIQSILTGQPYLGGPVLTEAAFRERAEKYARGAFGHLKDQFDSGLTLDDIFGNYRDIASRVLEIDPSRVDYMAEPDKWLRAFGDSKTGQMSLSDWVRELKTNKDYGWQFTNQANQQVSSVVSTLERAFGFRR
jgi:hypothetical protein